MRAYMCVYVCVRIYPYPLIPYFNIRVQLYSIRLDRVRLDRLHPLKLQDATRVQRATSCERGRVTICNFVDFKCCNYCIALLYPLTFKSEFIEDYSNACIR